MSRQFPDPAIIDPAFSEYVEIPDESMYALVRKRGQERPGEPALSFLGVRMSYGRLLDEIESCARGIQALGFREGDVFAICMPNTPETAILYYAVNRLGGICNMIHPLAPAAYVMEIIENTRSSYLCLPDLFIGRLAEQIEAKRADSPLRHILVSPMARSGGALSRFGLWLTKTRKAMRQMPRNDAWIRWQELLDRGRVESLPQAPEGSDRVAVYLHSGGTTGAAKTIMLTDRNFNSIAVPIFAAIGVPAGAPPPYGESFVNVLPLFHGFGLCIGLHAMLVNGACSILVPQFSTKGMASIIKKERPTLIAGVPTLFEALLNAPVMQKADLSSFKAIFCGGDSLTPELKERFDRFLKERGSVCRLREGYGLTETVTVCSITHDKSSDRNGIGHPLANMEMKIIDPETREMKADGERGEICVTGPTVMAGYLNDEEATRETLVLHDDGKVWVETGDLGYRDPDGYYHFTSRLKRMIKVSGIPVFPAQIEEIIASMPEVLQTAVIGIPHPYRMQVVKAFLKVKPDTDKKALEERIVEAVAERLLPYAVPKEFEYLEEFPKTLIGKIDTRLLEEKEAIRRGGL